jgi:hypothetical protein
MISCSHWGMFPVDYLISGSWTNLEPLSYDAKYLHG